MGKRWVEKLYASASRACTAYQITLGMKVTNEMNQVFPEGCALGLGIDHLGGYPTQRAVFEARDNLVQRGRCVTQSNWATMGARHVLSATSYAITSFCCKSLSEGKNFNGSNVSNVEDGTSPCTTSARYNVNVSEASNARSEGIDRGPKASFAIGWRYRIRPVDLYVEIDSNVPLGFSWML